MSVERLRELLEQRAAGQWEIYRKKGHSQERDASARFRTDVLRDEEGWAARWFEGDALFFASAASADGLVESIPQLARFAPAATPRWNWPSGRTEPTRALAPSPWEAPPDLFEELARLLASESRGEATLKQLSLRRGRTWERIENASGLEVEISSERLDGMAYGAGRRAGESSEARVLFRWDAAPDLMSVARRLCDRVTLPLSLRVAPAHRGEWLLEPAVAASLLAAIAPIFTTDRPPRWIQRGRFCAETVTIADDATADAPFDGEGTPTRRVLLVEDGQLRGRLRDLESSAKGGGASTGHGVRPSYRVPPSAAPRRLVLETERAVAPMELLSSVRRGLFASALTAPIRVDLDADRYEVEFTGVSIVAGRAQGPVAGARARGRLSRLLQDVVGSASDLQFVPVPYPVGTGTLLVGHAQFD
jgi:predicted Zn-dependent protease